MAASVIAERPRPVPSLGDISALLGVLSLDSSTDSSGLIDTADALSKMLDTLEGLPTTPPSPYIDLEGEKLSRHGTVSILQLHDRSSGETHLIDIKVLGHKAFTTQATSGRTLKEVLESEHIPKVFFDVRNDSDALYSHFQIKLAGIQDLQLMQLASREQGRKRLVCGLAKCIEYDAPMTRTEKAEWKCTKEGGIKLFDPKHGGSYKVFDERPLRKEIREYCIQDTKFLPRLWSYYDRRLTSAWRNRVREAAQARVTESQGQNYLAQGQHKALAPAGWR